MRSLLTLMMLTISLAATAQQKLDWPVGWSGGNIRLHTISNKEDQSTCHFLLSGDSIKVLLLDRNITIVKQFARKRGMLEEYRGAFMRDNNIYLFTSLDYNVSFQVSTFNVTTGAVVSNNVPFDLKNEKTLCVFNGGNRLLCLNRNKKTDEIVVHEFTNATTYATTACKVTDEAGMTFLKKAVNTTEAIDEEGEMPMKTVSHANKLYLHQDTLYLLVNNQKFKTKVYVFDLKNHVATERIVSHREMYIAEEDYRYSANSFLLNDRLYLVQATYDTLVLEVIDFRSGIPVKSYKIGTKDIFPFKHTAILEETEGIFRVRQKELKATRQLVKRVCPGPIVVMANPYNKDVQLTIGTWVNASGPAMSGSGNMIGGGRPAGGVRFAIYMDPATGAEIKNPPVLSIYEQIEQFKESGALKIPKEAEAMFSANGKYYFVRYDKTTKSLSIQEFPLH